MINIKGKLKVCQRAVFLGRRRGFALLMAILIASIVLTLGMTLSVVALKEFGISTLVRDSMLTYYASESGSECARYWSVLDKNNFSTISTTVISCDGNPFTFVRAPGANESNIFDFEYGYSGYPYYTKVRVTRNPGSERNIDVESEGFNTIANVSNKVERYKKIKISGLCALKPDIVVVQDISSSICGPDWCPADPPPPPGTPTEWEYMQTAITDFINALNPSENIVHLGQVRFGSKGIFDSTFPLHINASKEDNLAAVNVARLTNQATNTQYGLRLARYELTGSYQVDQNNANVSSPEVPAHDRLDFLSPDFVILITDGAPTVCIDPVSGGVGEGAGCDSPLPYVTVTDTTLSKTIDEANLLKEAGVTVIVVGVGVEGQMCDFPSNLPYTTCSDFLKYKIASDPTLYYGTVFHKLDSTLSGIRNCVYPLIEK